MKAQEQVLGTILKPNRVRIPGAVAAISCALIILIRDAGHITETDAIGIVASILVLFFKPNDRPFWFFAGIAVSVLLIEQLPTLHSLFVH
jgi:hypothetical protein